MVAGVRLKFEIQPGEDCKPILQVFGNSYKYLQLLQSVSEEGDEFDEDRSVDDRECPCAFDENDHVCGASSVEGGVEPVGTVLRPLAVSLD